MLTGNKQALRISGELVRFLTKPKFWADAENGDYPGVVGAEHAHWTGHFHGHINTLRAILEYAIATNDSRLKSFVRDGYAWARQHLLARIGFVGDGQGCGCGRLIGLAVKLSDAGVGDYWEDVDHYIRNQGIEMQFTSEDIDYLKKLGEGKLPPPEDFSVTTEGVYKATIGAYCSNVIWNQSTWIECCSSHGNMGLFYAWDGTLRYEDGVARINLLLNRDSPWMDIDSYLPFEGKVVITNKKAKDVFVRIPLWVNMSEVKCTVGKNDMSNNWFGNYLRFRNLKETDILTIRFPMVEKTETWNVMFAVGEPQKQLHTIRFRGNTVVELKPPLQPGSPLYQRRVAKYKATTAPTKKVIRNTSPIVLKW